MNILYVTHQFLPDFVGGTEILTWHGAREFLNRGHRVRIFTGFKSGSGKKQFDSYQFENILVDRWFHHWNPEAGDRNQMLEEYHNPSADQYFKRIISRYKPDIVHIYHLHRLSVSLIDICRKSGIPVVFTATDYWMMCPTCQLFSSDGTLCPGPQKNAVNCIKHLSQFDPKLRWIRYVPDQLLSPIVKFAAKKSLLDHRPRALVCALLQRPDFIRARIRQADRVLVPTRFMKQLYSRFGIDDEKIRILPFGVDFQNHGRGTGEKGTGEKLRIAFIGTLYFHKGAHVLCEAMKRISTKKLELAIYGSKTRFATYVNHLESIVRNDDRISFRGTFPPRKLWDVLHKVDALIVPSLWYENTPLVIHSAQAAEVPVIASDVGGVNEIVTHGENGLLFERGNAKMLARQLQQLCIDRQKVRQMSHNAKKPLSISQYADKLEGHYQEIMHG